MNHNFSMNSKRNKKITKETRKKGDEILEECISIILHLCQTKLEFVMKKIDLSFIQILLYILDWNEDKIISIRMKILRSLKYLTNNKLVFKDTELLPIALKVILKAADTDNNEAVALSLECIINILIIGNKIVFKKLK